MQIDFKIGNATYNAIKPGMRYILQLLAGPAGNRSTRCWYICDQWHV